MSGKLGFLTYTYIPIESGMPKGTGSKVSPIEMAITDKQGQIETLR